MNSTTRMAPPLAIGSLNYYREFFCQPHSPDDLRVISQTPDTPLAANPEYVYSIDESEETFIYDIGHGINRAHRDFSDRNRKIEWLYTPQTIRHHHDTPTEMPSDNNFHSTCTASKAAGMFAGSAKQATLVVVKAYPNFAGYAEVFETVTQDIVAKGRTHHSVVSFTWARDGNQRCDRKLSSDIMKLVRRGVPVILAAGNGRFFRRVSYLSRTSSPTLTRDWEC